VQTYDTILKELTIAITFKEEMKKQILEAVNRLYLAALDDDTFGFAEVSIADMVTHLHTTCYGPITHLSLKPIVLAFPQCGPLMIPSRHSGNTCVKCSASPLLGVIC